MFTGNYCMQLQWYYSKIMHGWVVGNYCLTSFRCVICFANTLVSLPFWGTPKSSFLAIIYYKLSLPSLHTVHPDSVIIAVVIFWCCLLWMVIFFIFVFCYFMLGSSCRFFVMSVLLWLFCSVLLWPIGLTCMVMFQAFSRCWTDCLLVEFVSFFFAFVPECSDTLLFCAWHSSY